MSTEYRSRAIAATPWVVVNTQPHREQVAVENLARQAFDCYCPMIMKRVRQARKHHDVLRPLFSSYLFVQVNPRETRWRPILSTMGVRSLVRFGNEPSLVSDDFITSLRAREVDGRITPPEARFKIGDPVRLVGGPFDGVVAEIIEMADKDRLVVLMALLNQKVKVDAGGLVANPC